jgi:2-keto-4-pentenoate hydratase/2-oxohepta-3-ene-1,7-dioic acid hydratase in catechol pathway
MKLATFLLSGGAQPFAGEVLDDRIVAFQAGTVLDRLASGDRTPADGATHPLDEVTLLAPVPRPPAIFCIGRNYAAHIAELGSERPDKQWSRAKGFDTSCPWGPWITTADEVPDPHGLRITTHVNGEQRQDGNTSDLIFGPEELVDFIAEACTLEPGAIILTGTPSGVGEAFDPPRYLEPGDVVRCEVEGLGAIEHPIS